MRYMSKFSRIQEILNLLSRGRKLSIEELQEKFETSKRTIQRYLHHIKNNMGIEVAYDRVEKRYYLKSVVEGIPFARLFLTEEEIYALRSALDFLKKRKNFPLIQELEGVITKMEDYMRIFEYQSIFEITDYVIPADFRDYYKKIKKAIYDRKYVEFDYYGSKEGKEIRRKVAPWFLIYSFGKWYLIGYCTIRDEMRTFNLKKIKNLDIIDEDFTEVIGKDIDEFKRDMFGPWKGEKPFWVSIFYDREAAKYIKDKFFPQETEKKFFEDGSMRLKIKVSSPEAVLFYLVLPYHYHAEIEKPSFLKKKLIEYLKKTLEKYREK